MFASSAKHYLACILYNTMHKVINISLFLLQNTFSHNVLYVYIVYPTYTETRLTLVWPDLFLITFGHYSKSGTQYVNRLILCIYISIYIY